jgi:hypothetical protein
MQETLDSRFVEIEPLVDTTAELAAEAVCACGCGMCICIVQPD